MNTADMPRDQQKRPFGVVRFTRITKAAPAGNRGLTTTTVEESNDGCI
jgi:hypothetical protein